MSSHESTPSETSSLIPDEVRELFPPRQFHRANVERVAGLLPADDLVLDAWLAEVLHNNDWGGFFILAFAAAASGRAIDSRHIVRSLAYFRDVILLVALVSRMTGDLVKHVVDALCATLIQPHHEAMALCLAVNAHKSQGDSPLPPELIAAIKSVARHACKFPDREMRRLALSVLCHVGKIAGDSDLSAFLIKISPELANEEIKRTSTSYVESIFTLAKNPILILVKGTEEARVVKSGTVRRAVEKHSRNELCPCGSGKKYKRCCEEKDKERLRHSSSVAGKTVDEVYRSPEEHLTLAQVKKAVGFEVARWDFAKIDPALHQACFDQLALFMLVDEAAAAFEKTGFRIELHEVWERVGWLCMYAWRREPLMRLLAVRTASGLEPEELHMGIKMLGAGSEPRDFVEALKGLSLEALQKTDTLYLQNLAYALLSSPLKALGILVARSVIPLVSTKDASRLLEIVVKAHDKLALPPDDPFADILEKRIAEESHAAGHDTEELREARRNLEAKAAEVRRLKLDMDNARREIERREKKRAAQPTSNSALPPKDDAALHDLRLKVAALKGSLKEHNEERAGLRKELQKLHHDLEELRAAPTGKHAAASAQDSREDAHELPPEQLGVQPVRLITFPSRFQNTIDGLPRQIAKQAMQALGRIASGESTAFMQVVRLKALPGISRIRLGIDHRMLFRLTPHTVEVVDIVSRQDLERRIKTLVAAGA